MAIGPSGGFQPILPSYRTTFDAAASVDLATQPSERWVSVLPPAERGGALLRERPHPFLHVLGLEAAANVGQLVAQDRRQVGGRALRQQPLGVGHADRRAGG